MEQRFRLAVGKSGGSTPPGATERPDTQPSNEAVASSNPPVHQPFRLAGDNGIDGAHPISAAEIPPGDSPKIPKICWSYIKPASVVII